MKVIIERNKIIKPIYEGNKIPTSNSDYTPLSVFDKVSYNIHVAVIYGYKPPTPANATIELGLQKALSQYREWAGRLGHNRNGDPVIFLNDKGVKIVEATMDIKLDQLLPLKPSSFLLNFHPKLKDVEELLQVQFTRFSCGSLVVGFTAHHLVADGFSTSNFLVAWGKATRGFEISPLPLRDRTIFSPRNPPKIEFEHERIEFKSKKNFGSNYDTKDGEEIEIVEVRFTLEFISKLKARASSQLSTDCKPYSTFESMLAHLWKTITKARELNGSDSTRIKVSVNGRMRMIPKVPNEYFGNLVLWAYPSSRVEHLLQKPLSHAAKLIRNAVENVNDKYFKSFIDFATLKANKNEDLVPVADPWVPSNTPNLKIDSWLRFPFYELDFGGGSPFLFMPSYVPVEGFIFLQPSFMGDGSISATVALFRKNMDTFKQIVHTLE